MTSALIEAEWPGVTSSHEETVRALEGEITNCRVRAVPCLSMSFVGVSFPCEFQLSRVPSQSGLEGLFVCMNSATCVALCGIILIAQTCRTRVHHLLYLLPPFGWCLSRCYQFSFTSMFGPTSQSGKSSQLVPGRIIA